MRSSSEFVDPPEGGAFAHDPVWMRRDVWRPTTLDELERGVRLFLRDTDVVCSGARGALTLNGTPADLDGVLERSSFWGHPLDIVVDRNLQDALLASVTRHLADRLPADRITTGAKGGVRVDTSGHAHAVIRATRGDIVRSDGRSLRLEAHFLRDGNQWTKLAGVLGLAPASRRGLSPRVSRAPEEEGSGRVLTVFPVELDAPTSAAIVRASRHLRESRRVAFGHRVALTDEDGRLTFEVLEDGNPLEARFEYATDDAVLRGALRLRTPQAPLALWLDAPAPDELVAEAWVAALLGLEQLLCADDPSEDGRPSFPPTLSPTGETVSLIGHYVVGHPRRLPEGQTPDSEKRKAAHGLGIALAENETWVRPHLRGAPEDTVLEFTWRRNQPRDS